MKASRRFRHALAFQHAQHERHAERHRQTLDLLIEHGLHIVPTRTRRRPGRQVLEVGLMPSPACRALRFHGRAKSGSMQPRGQHFRLADQEPLLRARTRTSPGKASSASCSWLSTWRRHTRAPWPVTGDQDGKRGFIAVVGEIVQQLAIRPLSRLVGRQRVQMAKERVRVCRGMIRGSPFVWLYSPIVPASMAIAPRIWSLSGGRKPPENSLRGLTPPARRVLPFELNRWTVSSARRPRLSSGPTGGLRPTATALVVGQTELVARQQRLDAKSPLFVRLDAVGGIIIPSPALSSDGTATPARRRRVAFPPHR